MMQRLNRMFDGDWLLTVAAYNSGEGRVMQAVKANKRRGKPTNFWALSLPRETSPMSRNAGAERHHQEQQEVRRETPKTDETRALARIDVGQQIQLTQAAEMAGLSVTKMKAYNPKLQKALRHLTGPTLWFQKGTPIS